MDENTTPRVKVTTAAGFLGTVPALLGYQPVDSLVVVMFAGKTSQGAIRVDAQQLAADPGGTFTTIEHVLTGAPVTPDWLAVTLWLERPSTIIDAAALMFYVSMLEDAGRTYRDVLIVEPGGWQSLLTDAHGPRSELEPPEGVPAHLLEKAQRPVEEARKDPGHQSAYPAEILESAITAALLHND